VAAAATVAEARAGVDSQPFDAMPSQLAKPASQVPSRQTPFEQVSLAFG